ncbi:MAG TPA: hypothetical protein VG652_09860 [Gaiellaceae bacterium]|nr:hypothetical protein [Gaiellaceae bacterium]
MDEPTPLMEVRDETEGNDICERLRAAGVKCAVESLPDANSFTSIWGGRAEDVLKVLVNGSDMDRARSVIRDYERDTSEHRVSICETRPLPGASSELGKGFEAICECDWTGPIRDTSDEAMNDARKHSRNVSPDIVWAPRGS